MSKVLLFGYFGFGNIGDEAILEAEVLALRSHRPDIELAALIDNKERAAELGIKPYKRKSIWQVYQAVKEANLVISGGGGLFQDSTGPASIMYYGSILALACILNKPTFIFSQGFGPIKTDLGKMLASRLLPLTTKATFRDELSLQEFKSFAPGVEASLSADPAFLLPRNVEESEGILQKCHLADPQKKIVVLVVRNWFGLDIALQAEAVNKWASSLSEEEKPQVLIVPFQYWFDEGICKRLQSLIKLPCSMAPQLNAREMLNLLGHERIELILSMRLHALILGASAGKVSLGISYDPKVERFCNLCGLPFVPLEGLTAERLAEALQSAWQKREELKMKVIENAGELRHKAEESVNLALELLS